MELVYQVAGPTEMDEIHAFAAARLAQAEPDETARTFLMWQARWRQEALQHYLRLGWSFTVRRKPAGSAERGALAGFFLGQPFLFMRGFTQTLWVEHLDGDSAETREGLVEVAIRLAREKHLQRVLFSQAESVQSELGKWPHSRFEDAIIEVKTTKA